MKTNDPQSDPLPKKRFRLRIDMLKIFRRNRSSNANRSRPWAHLHEKKGENSLLWGMGDGRTFGILSIRPDASFRLEEDGIHLHSGAIESVIGVPGKSEENILLGIEIEKALRKKEGFLGKTAIGTGAIAGLIAILFLIGNTVGPDLHHLTAFSPSSLNEVERSNPASLPDSFPGMGGGLTCNVGH